MEYIVPDYYGEFCCTADQCNDTCCAGWQIVIDAKSMKKYQEYPGGFGNRLRNSIDVKNKCFQQYDRRCAFLNEENLCDIYAEAGKDMLCRTCREFPRHAEEYENVREISLSLACPEAAKLLLSKEKPVKLCTREGKGEEEYEDFDYMLFSDLLDAREMLFSILEREDVTIAEKMGMILAFGHDFQRKINRNELYLGNELIANYREKGIETYRRKIEKLRGMNKDSGANRMNSMREIFSLFYALEVLEDDWTDLLKNAQRELYGKGEAHYQEITQEALDGRKLQQLLWYFLYVYFAGAVYDDGVYEKTKLAVVSTLLIQELLFARRAQNKHLDFEDYVDIAHRFAKEVEHSEENIWRMEKELMEKPVYGLVSMLGTVVHEIDIRF